MRWWIGALASLAITSVAFAAPAPTEEPKLVEVSADGSTIYFAGRIDFPAFLAFSKELGKNPGIKRLVIASQGGEVRAGQLMAASVAIRKLAVHVEHLCSSSCTLVLLSGPDRSMGPDAKIGFHKSYFVGDPELSDAPDGNVDSDQNTNKVKNKGNGADISDSRVTSNRLVSADVRRSERYGDRTFRRAMEQAGVGSEFADRALATPSAEMWYPERAELLAAHVVTRLDDATPRPGGPSWTVARAAAGDILTGTFWTTLAAKRPAMWTALVDDMWRARNAGMPADEAARSARLDIPGELATDIARAPDELVSRLLTIHAAQAAQVRREGYRPCRLSGDGMTVDAGNDPYMLAEEEAALTEMLLLPKLRKPLKTGKAVAIVAAFSASSLDDFDDAPIEFPDLDTDCRDGLQIIETIDAAPAKQRVEVYRALLSLFE